MELDKQYITFDEACKMFDIKRPDFITVDKSLNRRNEGEYQIVRGHTHDGTLIFTKQLIGEVIENLIHKSSYHIPNIREVVGYTVSDISLASVFGRYNINGTIMHGERQRARITVKCKYQEI